MMVELKACRRDDRFIASARANGKIGDILVETAFALRDLVEQISERTGNEPDMLMDAIATAVRMLPKRCK
ncbi:MAG: hypothetical protein RSC06_07055 [Clostridia bacterium]